MNSYALFAIRLFRSINDKLMIKLTMSPLAWLIHVSSDEEVTTFGGLNEHEYKILNLSMMFHISFTILRIIHKVLLELDKVLLS